MLVGGNRPVDGHVPPPPEPVQQELAEEAHDWHSKIGKFKFYYYNVKREFCSIVQS